MTAIGATGTPEVHGSRSTSTSPDRPNTDNEENHIMANKGKTQLLITWVASPDKVSEMDRLVESHGSFMAKTTIARVRTRC